MGVAISTGPNVFVDAKIPRRHEKTAPKKTIVAYSDKGESVSGVREVKAEDTDDAELHAVVFAISELKNKFDGFTIVSDHESIVSEINERKLKSGVKRPVLLRIINELDTNPTIKVELLANNPAHRVLNKYLREHPGLKEL